MKTSKLTLIVLISTVMMGCAWFSPPHYDNNQYFIFAEMEANSRYMVNDCDDPMLAKQRIELMVTRSEILQTYSNFLPKNKEVFDTSDIINKQLLEFKARYDKDKPPSISYCKLKSKALVKELRRILKAMGHLQEL
jgi:hypothetical protein